DSADRLVKRKIRIIPRSAGVDLVIHVRDVADIGDMLLAINLAQKPVKHIEHDYRTCVTDMSKVVNGGTADIHAHVPPIDRLELSLGARQRVVEPKLQF